MAKFTHIKVYKYEGANRGGGTNVGFHKWELAGIHVPAAMLVGWGCSGREIFLEYGVSSP